ncbi:hypothetical protein D3C71_735010 [compost metagenome]
MRKIYTLLGCLFLFQVSNNASAQVIFSEDFSSATGTTPPTGWTNNEILLGGGEWAFDNPDGRIGNLPLSAPFAIFDSDYLSNFGEETALESPVFDATGFTGGAFFLVFDHYFRYGAGGEYYVEVFDGTDWVSVLDGTTEMANSEHVILDITSVVNGITDAQVRFRWVGDYSWYWIVDNVSVEYATCFPISALALGNETPNSVEATWTAGATETSWNVEWGVPGFTPGTGAEIGSDAVTTESVTINGLNPGTDYDVYVQADCGGGDEAFWIKVRGATACAPISNLPWTENFDLMSELGFGIFKNCWSATEEYWFSDYTGSNETDAPAHSGANFMAMYSGDADTLWTPEFQLVAGKNYEFKFFFAGDPYEYDGWNGKVVLFDNQTSTSTALAGGTFVTPTEVMYGDYNDHTTCFTPTASGVYRFGISLASSFNPIFMTVDDFSLIERGTSAGTNGTMDVCQTEGLVSLNDIITKDDEFGSWSFPGNPSTIVNDTMFNPQFLPAGIVNVNYITTGCLEDTVSAIITIFPPSSAGIDGNVTVCKNEPMNLLEGLTGTVNLGGDWYDAQNQLLSSSQIMSPNFAGQYNYKYITGNSVCANDTSGVLVTVTTCNWLSVDEMALEDVTVYPNPSTGVVFIESNFTTGTFNLVVMDVNGRTVDAGNNSIAAGTNTVNLSKVQKGTYFFKLSNENAEKVYRVVIQ